MMSIDIFLKWRPFLLLAITLSACSGPEAASRGAASQEVAPQAEPRFQVLVFSKTTGFRHNSIPAGRAAVEQLGVAHGFAVDATEDASVFTPTTLGRYEVVIFLNTSGDMLDAAQQAAFEAYVQGGGGFVGVHGAAASEYDWAWYGGLVGAFFDEHPTPQEATVLMVDRSHPSTQHLPARWHRFDEWYTYRTNPRSNVHVLATLDEQSYEGGTMGHDHPIAWAHAYDGGRAWYTGLGHTEESYADPLYLRHLLGGITWAAGAAAGDVGATLAANYEKVVLIGDVTDPMELAIAPDGRVFVAERMGAIKMWDPATGTARQVGYVPVHMIIEDGLLGLTLDPSFEETGWLYVFYAPVGGGPSRLSRLTFDGEAIDMASEKVLLEVPVQREDCCHAAGSLTFDLQGNLYLSTGDNTDPYDREGSPIDERPGHARADAQRSSGNTNDLRGKIIRIRPLPDGTYAIPEGNLFPEDAQHRPEIYTMGHRNPFRIVIDPKTGDLYWGDVGNGDPPNDRGSWGWDEWNRATGPGNFGWPYFAGKNDPYRDYDYETGEIGDFFDPAAPLNDSPNNTGARELPPAQPALIWYTYGMSDEFPALGAGGINPMAGPVYRYNPETAGPSVLPAYYDGRFIIYEWMRNWVQVVTFDEAGEVFKIDPFLPGMEFVRPMDMEIGPDGALYLAEWGDEFWGSNDDAQVVRLDYYGAATRPSDVMATASITTENTTPSVSIEWPLNGGFFDYDESIAYKIKIADPGDGSVVVQPYTGFDTHKLPLASQVGTQGTFRITRDYTHTPDLHFVDRFALLEAYSDGGTAARVKLQPKRKQAEHVSSRRGARRRTHGMHPASKQYAATALSIMAVKAGDYVSYTPINLAGIESLTFRLKAQASGAIEIRLDAPDGPLLGEAVLDAASMVPVAEVKQARVVAEMLATQAALIIQGLDHNAYKDWSEVTVPLTDPGGTHELFLVFRSEETKKAFLELDWIDFNGPGMARAPGEEPR